MQTPIEYRIHVSFNSEETKNKVIKMLMFNKTGKIKPMGNDISMLMVTGNDERIRTALVDVTPFGLKLWFDGLTDLNAPSILEPFDSAIWHLGRFLQELPGVRMDSWTCASGSEYILFNVNAYWRDRLFLSPLDFESLNRDVYRAVFAKRLEVYDGRVFYKGRDTLGTELMTKANHHWLLMLPELNYEHKGVAYGFPAIAVGSVCSGDYDNYSVPNLSKYMKDHL